MCLIVWNDWITVLLINWVFFLSLEDIFAWINLNTVNLVMLLFLFKILIDQPCWHFCLSEQSPVTLFCIVLIFFFTSVSFGSMQFQGNLLLIFWWTCDGSVRLLFYINFVLLYAMSRNLREMLNWKVSDCYSNWP